MALALHHRVPWIGLSLALLATAVFTGSLPAVETKSTVNWIVLQFRGEADESGPPVVFWVDDEGRGSAFRYLNDEQSERVTAISAAHAQTIAGLIHAAAGEPRVKNSGPSPRVLPFRVVLGTLKNSEVVDLNDASTRLLITRLLAEPLENKSHEALREFAEEHGLLKTKR